MIEKLVVREVHEELRSGAVDVAGAGHRQRAALVLQAVLGLVLDRITGLLVLEVRRQPAALDHEAGDDPVERRAVEESLIHIAQEILDRDGRFLREKLDGEAAV